MRFLIVGFFSLTLFGVTRAAIADDPPAKSASEDRLIKQHIDWAVANPDGGTPSPDECEAYGLMKNSKQQKWKNKLGEIEANFPNISESCSDMKFQRIDFVPHLDKIGGFKSKETVFYVITVILTSLGLATFQAFRRAK